VNAKGSFFSVITTIQPPTAAVARLLSKLATCSGALIVAGDEKGPSDYRLAVGSADASQGRTSPVQFLNLQAQLTSPFELARKLPTGHYCRKNIGYLHAIAQGASCVYETDDDNAPLSNWCPRAEYLDDVRVINRATADPKKGGLWLNVYKYFTDAMIWPRGFPLDEIHAAVPEGDAECRRSRIRAPIQQGLVNNSPDVDAIWHLVLGRSFDFENRPSILLQPGNWCPFNTQSTWWWPVAYPLLYVPSYCSFRMCDIWKSFVAQRCLWALGCGVAFHPPEVVQERNYHDLMRDFRDEVPGYNRNRELASVLNALDLAPGERAVSDNLITCYKALVMADLFPEKELELVDAWLVGLEG
jgi:hypothetical protein